MWDKVISKIILKKSLHYADFSDEEKLSNLSLSNSVISQALIKTQQQLHGNFEIPSSLTYLNPFLFLFGY